MPSHTLFEQQRQQRRQQFAASQNLGMPPSVGAPAGIPQPPGGMVFGGPAGVGAPTRIPQPPMGVPNITPPAIGAPPSFEEPLPPAFGRPLTIPPSSNPMLSAPSAFMGGQQGPGGIQQLMGRFQQALPFLQQFGGFGGGMGAPQQFQGFAPQLQRSPQAQQLLGQQPTRGFGLGLFG